MGAGAVGWDVLVAWKVGAAGRCVFSAAGVGTEGTPTGANELHPDSRITSRHRMFFRIQVSFLM
jgi:hypothetical protein